MASSKAPRAVVGFEDLLNMCKLAWAPVLKLLAREGDYSTVDFRRIKRGAFPFPEIVSAQAPSLTPPVIWYPTVDQVVRIHDEMISAFGGEPGVLNLGFVDSAIQRIRYSGVYGKDIAPTLTRKAASLMHAVLTYHPFVDGQKRTGISTAFIFLGMNGFSLWSRDVAEDIAMAVDCAAGKVPMKQLNEWISHRAFPLDDAFYLVPWNVIARRGLRNLECPRCGRVLWKKLMYARCRHCGRAYEARFERGLLYTTYPPPSAHNPRTSEPAYLGAYVLTLDRISARRIPALRSRINAISSANKEAYRLLRERGVTARDLRRFLSISRARIVPHGRVGYPLR